MGENLTQSRQVNSAEKRLKRVSKPQLATVFGLCEYISIQSKQPKAKEKRNLLLFNKNIARKQKHIFRIRALRGLLYIDRSYNNKMTISPFYSSFFFFWFINLQSFCFLEGPFLWFAMRA